MMTLASGILKDLELLHLSRHQLDEAATLSMRVAEPSKVLAQLQEKGWVTSFQVSILEKGLGRELCIGPYVVVAKVGEGGMGVVYKAIQRALGRVVALKVLKCDRLASPRAVRRFQREAQVTAQLNHPNIVGAYDLGQADNRLYLVMEFVYGNNLMQRVEKKGPLHVSLACDYIRQTAIGMHYAHQRGMIHRDLKPQNLMLTRDKTTVKILDLGLARMIGEDAAALYGATQITQDGAIIGSLDFMAPEQAANARGVDARADLYSIGCTFYYLLTGRVPFPGGAAIEKISLHRNTHPVPVDAIRTATPAAVVQVVNRLMAKDPDDRFESCRELISAIDQIVGRKSEPQPIPARSRQPSPSPSPSPQLDEANSDRPLSTGSSVPSSRPLTGSSLPPTQVTTAAIEETAPPTKLDAGVTKEEMVMPTPMPDQARESTRKSRNWALAIGMACVIVGCLNLLRLRDENPMQGAPPLQAENRDSTATQRGSKLALDGRTGHILVPGWRYDGSYPLTIEAWVTPQKADGVHFVFGNFEQSGIGVQINAKESNNACWEFLIRSGQKTESIVAKIQVRWNQRTHLAVSFDGAKSQFFVDGQRQGELDMKEAFLPSSMPFLIGARPRRQAPITDYDTCDHFLGMIEEFRLSKSVHYATDFSPSDRFTTTSDSILLYHLDESKGDIAHDASGHKRHGIVKGGTTWDQQQSYSPSRGL